ncbi:MAG TPA: hypothetical protein VG710_12140 [Opitutus sp.]|nr:hypothetical protein [Opitutus sp.]
MVELPFLYLGACHDSGVLCKLREMSFLNFGVQTGGKFPDALIVQFAAPPEVFRAIRPPVDGSDVNIRKSFSARVLDEREKAGDEAASLLPQG